MQSSREMVLCWFPCRVICTVSTNFEVPSTSPHVVQVVVLMQRFRLQEACDVLVRSRRVARINVGDCCWCRTIRVPQISFRCCNSLVMYVSIVVELCCLFAM